MKNSPNPSIDVRDLNHPPVERAETIPSDWYIKDEFHHADREAVLSRNWQCVGHVSRVPNPGDAYPIIVAGNPVLILRDDENRICAYYNVCRHRGGPLMANAGSARFLKCLYHGWTYRLDGSLRGVPHFNGAELFDKSDFGLKSIRCQVRSGLIWINLSDDLNSELDDIIAGIETRIRDVEIENFKFAGEVTYDVKANWKVYVDNYLEGYHIPHVHPELCDLLSFQDYKTECHEWYSLQYSPFRKQESIYSDGSGQSCYYFVYPNSMLNILPGRMQLNRVEPVSAGKCKVIFEYYYDDISSPAARKKYQEDMAYSDKVQQEDIEICERVQEGLGSKVYDRGRFSPELEEAVHHFQGCLKKSYLRYFNEQ